MFEFIKNLYKKKETEVSDYQSKDVRSAEVYRNIQDHPSDRITPAKLKAILDSAEQGDLKEQHALFADIEERDSDISSAISTRKRALLTVDWRIVPPKNATDAEMKIFEMVEEYFYQLPKLDDVIYDMMDAVGHGFSAQEIIWEKSEKYIYPMKFTHRPQDWFKLGPKDVILLLTDSNPMGEPLWPNFWIVHEHKNRSLGLARNGLYRTVCWLYMFKHYSVHDFAEFLELYGMPIRIGKYGAGTSDKEKRTFLRALADLGHNGAGIIPESMNIELHSAANGVTGTNPFLQMIDWCEKQIARLILGQTLTSGADGKSSTNALGKVHNEVRRDLMVSDAKQIAQTITEQIIYPLVQVNFDATISRTRIPYFKFDLKERKELESFSKSLKTLVETGVKIPVEWVYEQTGIPVPQEDDEILDSKATDSVALSKHNQSCSCGCGESVVALTRKENSDDVQDILDDEIAKALTNNDFRGQLNTAVLQAIEILQKANSYDEAFDGIANLYPNLDTEQHRAYLNQAMFAAELLGGSDA